MSQKAFIRFLAVVLFALLLLSPPQGAANADSGASREYQVKAAFIFNFAQFVEWPADSFGGADSPLVIGVVGSNPFGDVLEHAVAGKRAGGRNIVLKHFRSAQAMERCHILFVSGSERDSMQLIVERSARENTLTVGDFDGFTFANGMIRFVTQDNRLRFEVNIEALNRARLKASAKLLKLAHVYGR